MSEAKKTSQEIAERCKVKTAAFKVDVSNFNEVQQLKVNIEKTMGFVDILVNNAGICSRLTLDDDMEDLKMIIDVNFNSHVWVTELIFHNLHVDLNCLYSSDRENFHQIND